MKGLSSIVARLKAQGTIEKIKPLDAGLINDTYKVNTKEADAPDYVLQHINHVIFQNVEMFQSNISAVTNRIRKKLMGTRESDIGRKASNFLKTEEDKTYWFDGDSCWCVMIFIPCAKTYEAVSLKYSNYAGEAFGSFQAMLADTPETLGGTIPDFHNIELHLRQLHEAVAKGATGRVAEVKCYLDKIEKRADEMCKTKRLYHEGKLPKRACHCDAKVNNMMFDEDGRVLCVIDLDVVTPSFMFSGYGDFLRTGASTGDEDDKDLDRVNFNMEVFKAFTKGYLKGAKSSLTQIEIKNLPCTAALFPYIQCIRFLAGYINGDTYYKIKYPEHNLVRTKAQFKLLQSVETSTPEMIASINECLLN